MRKAIQLKVMLWIEGEDEPAHNFAQSTTAAVKDIISSGSKRYPGLQVTVKNIVEDTDYDDEEESEPKAV